MAQFAYALDQRARPWHPEPESPYLTMWPEVFLGHVHERKPNTASGPKQKTPRRALPYIEEFPWRADHDAHVIDRAIRETIMYTSFAASASPRRVAQDEGFDVQGGADDVHNMFADPPQWTEDVTTLMLHNLPCAISQEKLMLTVDELGFEGAYDYVYVPWRGKSNRGYGIVNFVEHDDAAGFVAAFSNYTFTGTNSTKVCWVKPAYIQGREANLRRFHWNRGQTANQPYVRY